MSFWINNKRRFSSLSIEFNVTQTTNPVTNFSDDIFYQVSYKETLTFKFQSFVIRVKVLLYYNCKILY